ncbi:type II toxin-antitoxin system VapC family toxin [Helicobacter sp. T3_23-1059]
MTNHKVGTLAKYLLDTNILTYLINHNPPKVFEKIATMEVSDLATCSIVASELFFGVEKSKFKAHNVKALNQMLDLLVIYDFGLKEARIYAKILANLDSSGQLSAIWTCQFLRWLW